MNMASAAARPRRFALKSLHIGDPIKENAGPLSAPSASFGTFAIRRTTKFFSEIEATDGLILLFHIYLL
jgi:hypothetical protein